MGRRWWQKEARAKAEADRLAAKNAPVVESVAAAQNAEDPVKEEEKTVIIVDEKVEEIIDSLESTSEELQQVVQEIKPEHVDDATDAQEDEQPLDDVKVDGISITTSNFISQNNKKKRRR